jgi:hypothetical protein
MDPSTIIKHLFFLRAGITAGTGFTILWKGRTYMVSAKHIFEDERIDQFEMFHEGKWVDVPVRLERAPYKVDLVFGQMPLGFRAGYEIDLRESGSSLSEDVFIFGFPLNLYQDFREANASDPVPFVAKACIAAIPGKGNPGEGGLFIAGQIDEGFSGGPIVLVRDNIPIVIGVFSSNLRKNVTERNASAEKLLIQHAANLAVGTSMSTVTAAIDSHFGE